MNEADQLSGGFDYWVSDEQLAAFAKLSIMERLEWVEQARLFTLAAQTSETARRHALLREGGETSNDAATGNSV